MIFMDNHNLSEEQKFRITRFHTEEILLILFICSTDLSDYAEEDLVIFSECIEGRVEVLFDEDFLERTEIQNFLKLTSETMIHFKQLQEFLISLYSSEWSRKMKERKIWVNANKSANQILKELGLVYVEPIIFMSDDKYLNVDWT